MKNNIATMFKPVFMTLFTFLTPIKGLLLILALMVAIDTLLAIYVSIKLHGIKSFKSTILRKGIGAKLIFYLGTAILAFMVDKWIVSSTIFGIAFLLSKSITSLYIYIEVKSLDETSMKLGNRSIWAIAKELISRIATFKKEIKEVTDNEK